jgi:putative addiction module component (TIGR02574 family)
MSPRADALLAAVLELPEAERAELTDRLCDALDPPPDADLMTDEAFAAELGRRHAEFLRDPSVAIPWDEVKRMGAAG